MNNDLSNWANYGYYGSNSASQMSNSNPQNPNNHPQNPNIRPQIPNIPQNPNFPQNPNIHNQNYNFESQNSNFGPQHYPTRPMNIPGYQSNVHQGVQYYQFQVAPSSDSSRKTSIDGGSTDQETPTSGRARPFPGFSSPQGLEAINLNFDQQSDQEENDMTYKKIQYSDKECEHLTRCWIDISTDSIIGNDQKIDQMWDRITKAYNKGRPSGTPERSPSSVKTLFYKLAKETKWFSSCYYRNAEMWPSGASEADIIKKAQDEYIEIHGTRGFRHIGVWNLLKECPKFAHEDGEIRATKKGKSSASGAYTSASNPDDNCDETTRTRPIGNKAAKRNAAKGKGKSTSEAKEVADALNARAAATTMMAKALADKQKANEYKILMRDTSKMSETQLQLHLKYCAQIQKKWEAED